MKFQDYLSVNKATLDVTVSNLVDFLMAEGDTDRDRRNLTKSTYAALRSAIKEMMGAPEGNRFWGHSADVTVSIYRPPIGEDLFGRFPIQASRLGGGGMIPCPADWPTNGAKLPPMVESLLEAIREPKGTRVVSFDEEGSVTLGPDFGDRQYLFDENGEGELWLRPL